MFPNYEIDVHCGKDCSVIVEQELSALCYGGKGEMLRGKSFKVSLNAKGELKVTQVAAKKKAAGKSKK